MRLTIAAFANFAKPMAIVLADPRLAIPQKLFSLKQQRGYSLALKTIAPE
jgi:hypothetical protein